MASKISAPSTTFTATSLIPSTAKFLFLKPISSNEVFHHLTTLNPTKSTSTKSDRLIPKSSKAYCDYTLGRVYFAVDGKIAFRYGIFCHK